MPSGVLATSVVERNDLSSHSRSSSVILSSSLSHSGKSDAFFAFSLETRPSQAHQLNVCIVGGALDVCPEKGQMHRILQRQTSRSKALMAIFTTHVGNCPN